MEMTENTKKEKKWSLKYCPGDPKLDEAIVSLAQETGLSEIMASILYQRGFTTKSEVQAFFHQETAALHDPFLMQDMGAAVARIAQAIEAGERIAIYGDYDVDGVTSVFCICT